MLNLPWVHQTTQWFEQNFARFFDTPQHIFWSIVWIAVICMAIGFVFSLLLALVRYPSEIAVMRMVDEHETTGVKKTFKQGWRLGWNRRAFNLWLIDLIIGIPIFLVVMGFLAVIGAGIYNMVISGQNVETFGPFWAGIIVAFALFFLPFGLLCAAVYVLREYAARFTAIEGEEVGKSFSRGWSMFKHNFKNTFLIWLVLIGVGIAAGLALVLAAIILLPAYAIMALPGAVAAIIPGALGFGVTSLFAPHVWPWIIGALLAIPVFFAVTFSPVTFLSGWVTLFSSNVWTLTYRGLKAMQATPPPFTVETQVPPQVNAQ